nr:transporter substrate-binding domain-containing protein [Brevibacterium daeguense]
MLTGCGVSIPADPQGTLERVSGGELRVGISHQPPWTDITGSEAPSGIEVDLVEEFAGAIDAEVAWTPGGEEQLMMQLQEDQLDMIVGGFTDSSPWTSHAALTTPYVETKGLDGSTAKHVMATVMGENEFTTTLEQFLLDQDVRL